MKKSLFIPVFFVLAALTAYTYDDKIKGNGIIKSEDRTLSDFDKISIAGAIDLVIIPSGDHKATVTADENLLQYIITEVKDNTLSIHPKKDVQLDAKQLTVRVNAPTLKAISAGGSGKVSSEGTIKGAKLDISKGGSGEFALSLDVDDLHISKAGSGDFTLQGKASSLHISTAGSGNVHAEKLDVHESEISMAGSGDVFLPKGHKPKVSKVGSGDVHNE